MLETIKEYANQENFEYMTMDYHKGYGFYLYHIFYSNDDNVVINTIVIRNEKKGAK